MYEKLQDVTPSPQAAGRVQEVLIVDDNSAFRTALAELFANEGYRVRSVDCASRALEALTEQAPDLILCDVVMPGMDGLQFHECLVRHHNWCHIPFVFLSTQGNAEQIRQGKELGCDDYLTKPVDPDELLAVVRGKLAVASQRRQREFEQAERFRKRIINTLSHEFRTPLVAIHTGAELLLNQKEVQDLSLVKRLVEAIYRGGNRLERLVSDFMTLQQIQSGSTATLVDKLRTTVDVRMLIRTAIENFTNSATSLDGKRAPDVIFSDIPAIAIEVFEPQIVDVIERLLSNAYKFGGEGNPIDLEVHATNGRACISIRDRGPGMPSHVLESACESFVQIDRDKIEQQGCGLGLAIAQHYTSINGGSLTFHSPVDGGLEVNLSFPLRADRQLVEESSE